jgi:hypothetical protein
VRAQRPEPAAEPAELTPVAEPPAELPAEMPAGGPVDLDDVIVAWSAVLPELPPSSRRALQDFQPVGVEGDVVVFGIAPHLLDVAKPRFHQEAHTIRAQLTPRLGRNIRFKLSAHEGFTTVNASKGRSADTPSPPKAARPARPSSREPVDDAPPPPEPPPELDDEVDLTELRDAPPIPAVDSITRLQERFGASVVEELPRD